MTISINSFYKAHEASAMTDRRWAVANELVTRMRAGYMMRVQLDGNTAKSLKTTVKTLDNCFPESWYEWDGDTDKTYLNLPIELSSDIAIALS